MAVISVEVPDEIAKKVNYNVISIQTLYSYDDDFYSDVVDFGKNGIGRKEFEDYLNNK